MRYLILVEATGAADADADAFGRFAAAMDAYERLLARAGVLLEACQLRPSALGWRVGFGGDRRHRVEGPFAGAAAITGGFAIVQVGRPEELDEWVRRFPVDPADPIVAGIEVRRLLEPGEDRAWPPA